MIGNQGLARFADADGLGADGTVNVTFGTGGDGAHDGFGTLELDHAPGAALVVNNFGVGDMIDLTGIPDATGASGTFLHYDPDADTLTVTDPEVGDWVSIQLSGS